MRQLEDRYIVRMPDGMRDQVKVLAARNRRSMKAEIILMIENALSHPGTAATGDGLANSAPAAAQNTAALQGGDIITNGL